MASVFVVSLSGAAVSAHSSMVIAEERVTELMWVHGKKFKAREPKLSGAVFYESIEGPYTTISIDRFEVDGS